MVQRVFNATKWMWCFLILGSGPAWSGVNSVTIRTPPSVPSTIEAQAKFFQDFFSVQLSPYNIEFGHVCEDPNTWEQRYEKKDFKNHRDMGKVRWGDKKGGYGEHYWDLNHAGHTGNHDSNDYDDGSYHEDPHDTYEEPNDQPHSYDADEYNPDDTSHYEENGRAKRAHTKIQPLSRQEGKTPEEEQSLKQNIQRDNKEEEREDRKSLKQDKKERRRHNQEDHIVEDNTNDEVDNIMPVKPKPKRRIQAPNNEENNLSTREKNHIVLIVNQRDKDVQEDFTQKPEPKRFVPYEDGAGVRQHIQPEVAETTAPRLFLDPRTGHIVDRATGQAYVLQPLPHNVRYN